MLANNVDSDQMPCYVGILMDSSTVISRISLFVILGRSELFPTFIPILMENPVSKQCRP